MQRVFIALWIASFVGSRVAGQQVGSPTQPGSGPDAIGMTQAIKIAEQFVRENGYTDFVPRDASRLTPESIERSEQAEWIARRHDTLRPQAYGYRKGRKNDVDGGWTVFFERADGQGNGEKGRAVTMDVLGNQLRVEHKDALLKFAEPRPKSICDAD